MLKNIWSDESGALLSVELILLMVITVIGITVGMVVLRDAIVTELQDLAAAINSVDAGFGWGQLEYGSATSSAYVNGSTYNSANQVEGAGFILNSVVGDNTLFADTLGTNAQEVISSP